MRIAAATAVALTLLTTACGGSPKAAPASQPVSAPAASAAPSPEALSQKQQADAYLKAVNPANTALTTFKSKINDNSTAAQVAAAAKPLIAAITQANQDLARVQWTGQAVTDIRTLITADGQLAGDLRSVEQQNAFSLLAFLNQISRDGAALGSAVTIIRADLGLPPSAA